MSVTGPQRRVLQAVAAGEVFRLRSVPGKTYPVTPGISGRVLDRLVVDRLVRYGGDQPGLDGWRRGPYVITEAGRAALAAGDA